MNKFFHKDLRNRFFNLFRIGNYLGHPEMKELNPTKRWKMLLTMRDLRLWVLENAPLSSRSEKYKDQLEAIIREVNYLQYRGIILLDLFIFIFDFLIK
jgi:hypothetical protein